MTKKEKVLQSVYNILNSIKEVEKFELFRNKEVDYELSESHKLVNIKDGSYNVIETVLSPRIDTIEQTIVLELYIQEQEEQDINTQLDEFEELIISTILSGGKLSELVRDITINYSPNDILEPENGLQIKKLKLILLLYLMRFSCIM